MDMEAALAGPPALHQHLQPQSLNYTHNTSNNNNNISNNNNNTTTQVARLPAYIDTGLLRYYSLSEQSRHEVANILWQLCESHPQITFAPTLYPIIAIFLHKHDQEYTYQAVCKLLQRNYQATHEKQYNQQPSARSSAAPTASHEATPLMPTTRLEHVRDVIVLIKLCTKFGLLAPLLMRDFVRAERRFLANLEREVNSRAALNNNNNLNNNEGYLLTSPIRRASRVTRRFSRLRRGNNNNNNGNSPSHLSDINNHTILNNTNSNSTQQHCKIVSSPFETPFFDWYRWIFVALPLTYCVRIIDCWLVDGQKFLYRLTLAMLSRFRQQCSSPVTLNSDKMFEFCEKLESTLERKGGIEQLIKEANSLKRISTVRIARERKKSESKANLIVGSIMRKDSQAIRLYNYGQTPNHINQPRQDMLHDIIISTRIAPRSLKSCIVDSYELLDDIWQYIPERAAVKNVSVVFNSNNDGTSLQTFFSRVDPYEESLIIIRTIKNEVFGAYCSSSWSQRKNQAQSASKKSFYFGNGETFLFTLQPMFSVYLWVGKTESDTNNPHQQQTASLEPSAPTTTTPHREPLQQQQNNNQVQPNQLKKNQLENASDSISTQLFMSATSQELIIGSGNGSFGLWLDADLTRGKTDHCKTFNNLPLCEDRDFTCKDVEVLAFS